MLGKEKSTLALALLISLAVSGITLYSLNLLQPKRVHYTYEELYNMNKEQLIQVIFENQRESGGLGKLIFPLSVIIAFLLSAAITFRLCKQSSVDKEVLNYLLRPEERKIVELLAEHGGEMKQVELVAMSGLNKVKIHRLLVQMEGRGLVEIVRVGKYNIVRLNKRVMRVF